MLNSDIINQIDFKDDDVELKYVGPKPIISYSGIEFDNNKEDKFVYLNIAVQFLHALDHDYFENKTYNYELRTDRLDYGEMISVLKQYCPNLESLMDKQNHDIEEEIQHNLQRAHENKVLNAENKEVLQNNIEIMHDYMVQRSINKAVYYCTVEALAEILKKDHIDYIIVPMFQKFMHVLHSVQGALLKQKVPIDTKIDIYQEGDNIMGKLQVVNLEYS